MKYNIGNEIVLEDGIAYTVVDTLEYNGNKYVYLGYKDEDGSDSFIIQKEENDNDNVYLVGLDSDKEFYDVKILDQKHSIISLLQKKV